MAGDGSRDRNGRLITFAVVLAGLFATSYSLGERLPGHDHGDDTASDSGHDHSGMDHSMPVEPDLPGGIDDGYRLVESLDAADGATRQFHLADGNGGRVDEFDLVHGALLHVVGVRPDLSDFFHVHPAIGADGSFEVTLPAEGAWHVVFESTPASNDGTAVVVSTDLTDGTINEPVALPVPVTTASVVGADGTELVVTLRRTASGGLEFLVADATGTPVEGLEAYLGQSAHLIALRSSDLAYAHLHPKSEVGDPTIAFGGVLPAGGTYRMFLQFGWAGSTVTVAFTLAT